MLEMIGECLPAIILVVWANKRLQSGKDFRTPLIAGLIIYALAIIGSIAGGEAVIGCIAAIAILGIAFVVLAGKVKQ
jgi:hypothetical protein